MQVKCVDKSPSSIAWCPVASPFGGAHLVSPNAASEPCANHTLIALGKRKAFESASYLEIMDTSLSHPARKAVIVGKVPSSCSFNKLAWGTQGSDSEETPFGLIAGGMDDGNVTIWNPYAVGTGDRKRATVHVSQHHRREVADVQWNAITPKYLASCGYDGQLFVWDLSSARKPSVWTPTATDDGSTQHISASSVAMTALDWNRKRPYILACSTQSGETQIYDLKQKNLALRLRTRNSVAGTGVSWHPSHALHVCVSYADSTAKIWDLRKPMSPAFDLVNGHTRTVCALAWCEHDSRLLLTSGDDKLGVIWHAGKGEILHTIDFEKENFDVEWSPLRAGVLGCSSNDGNISVYHVSHVGDKCTPAWMSRPSGVCFGFGGRFASFGVHTVEYSKPMSNGKKGKTSRKRLPPKVEVRHVEHSVEMVQRAQDFQSMLSTLKSSQDLEAFADRKIRELKTSQRTSDEEKDTWAFIKLCYAADSKKELLSHLGFGEEKKMKEIGEKIVPGTVQQLDLESEESSGTSNFDELLSQQQQEQADLLSPKDDTPPSAHDDEESDDSDFFQNLGAKASTPPAIVEKETRVSEKPDSEEKVATQEETEEKVDLTRKKSASISRFEAPSDTDRAVRNALVSGDYDTAVQVSLSSGHIADALVFAYNGSQELWNLAVKAFFKQHKQQFVSRVFQHVVQQNYDDLVRKSNLGDWKETLAILLSYCEERECDRLCNALARRLLVEADNTHGAVTAFLCSGNVMEAIGLWTLGLHESDDEKMTPDLVLHQCIEKALVFANSPIVKRKATAGNALADVICQYATLLANEGSLAVAAKFLEYVTDPQCPSGRIVSEEISSLLQRIALCDPDLNIPARGGRAAVQPVSAPAETRPSRSPVQRPTRPSGGRPTRAQRGGRPVRRRPSSHGSPQPTTAYPTQTPQTEPRPQPTSGMTRRGQQGPPARPTRGRPVRTPQRPATQPRRQPVQHMRAASATHQAHMQQQPQRQPQRQPEPQRHTQPPTQPQAHGHPTRQAQAVASGAVLGHRPARRPIRTSPIHQPIGNGTQSLSPSDPTSQPRPQSVQPTRPAMPSRPGRATRGRQVSRTAQPSPKHRQQVTRRVPASTHRSAGNGAAAPALSTSQEMSAPQSRLPERPVRPSTVAEVSAPRAPRQPTRAARGPRGHRGPRGPSRPDSLASAASHSQSTPGYAAPHPEVPQDTGVVDAPMPATTAGTGYYGESILKSSGDENRALPPDATQTVDRLFQHMAQFENINLTTSDTRLMQSIRQKLESLSQRIAGSALSYTAYSRLVDMTELLVSRQYAHALNEVQTLAKNGQEFKANKQWLSAFRSLVNIAKKYQI